MRPELLLPLLFAGASALLAPPKHWAKLHLTPTTPANLRLRLAAAPVEPEIPVAASEVRTELTEEQRAALQAFAEIDVDGDGELTADEIFRALSKNNADVTLERVQEIMAKADKDKNGTISQQEYLDAVAAMGPGWIGSWLGKIAARVTAVWAEPEQEPVDGEVVPEGEASAVEEVAIDVSGEAVAGEVTGGKTSAPHQFHEEVEIAPEQPLSPGFSNLQAELRTEQFALEPEAEA